jgi:putative endopeptidase
MNLSVDPGVDFFTYANYHWIADHPVPKDHKFYTAFEEVKDMVDNRVRSLVEDAATDYSAEKGTPRQLLGSFYRAALNDESNAKTGLTPIQDELDEIAQASDRSDIRVIASNLTARGLDPFFILYMMRTLRNGRNLSRPSRPVILPSGSPRFTNLHLMRLCGSRT